MTEVGRPLSAGIIDFNLKRMTPADAASFHIPSELQAHFADWRQYPLNIASHFPNGVSWFSAEQPWFFRSVLSDETQTKRLQQSDVLILSGSGMSAYHFQEHPAQHFSAEDINYLEKAQELVRSQLGEGKWVLGICFGGQLGMGAIGGTLGRLPGNVTEAGWLQQDLTAAGRQDEIMGGLPSPFFAPHFHNDYIQRLPAIGTVVHTEAGDISVSRAEVLAVRHGYLDKQGLEDGDNDFVMASVVEFDNGARFYQIQPHPEMATLTKANFLVRMNKWLAEDKEMGQEYYQKALNVPKNADFRIVEMIPQFIQLAKKHLEEQQGIRFVDAMFLQSLFQYLIP
jgi:GMP synthase-like glutamine amidotransferase